MKLLRTIDIAGQALAGHAFRSFLTALGIVFGVGAVVGMMAISEGARRESLARIEALGIDHIVVRSVKPTSGAAADQGSRAWTPLEYGVTEHDIEHVRTVFENVGSLVPLRDCRKNVYAHGVKTDIRVFATIPDFLALSRSTLYENRGRFLTDSDGDKARPVCVLGRTAARKLFRYEDPLGQSLRLEDALFQVVGVLYNPYDAKILGGHDLNNQIFVHLDAANGIFGKVARQQSSGSMESSKVDADLLYVKILDVDQIENTAARLRTYMDQAHPDGDYDVIVPYELLKQKEDQQAIFTIVMASIAAISLLVGGIGIMNIMMANVYERTKEIGTRRALGAKKRDILIQFLSEAVLLTAVGGALGVASGYGLAKLVQQYAQWPTPVTVLSIVISLTVSVFVGVLFGTYPAWQAANLDPIEALRRE